MAKSFTLDGAAGAGGPAQSTAPAPGATSSSASSASSTPTAPNLDPGGAIYASNPAAGGSSGGGEQFPASGSSSTAAGLPEGGLAPLASGAAPATGSGAPALYPGGGNFFAQGGGVPDDGDGDNDQSQNQGQGQQADPMSSVLQRALGSVDQVLQYGYQQYGLSTGAPADGSGGGQQMASNMPTVPGTQSNSGIPPQQPMPGPLPPTSNPFGKRADAGPGGIQEDDEETS